MKDNSQERVRAPSLLKSKAAKTKRKPTALTTYDLTMARIVDRAGVDPDCDGQILVTQDMLGMNQGELPSSVRKFAELENKISSATAKYINEIQAGSFLLRGPSLSKVARS